MHRVAGLLFLLSCVACGEHEAPHAAAPAVQPAPPAPPPAAQAPAAPTPAPAPAPAAPAELARTPIELRAPHIGHVQGFRVAHPDPSVADLLVKRMESRLWLEAQRLGDQVNLMGGECKVGVATPEIVSYMCTVLEDSDDGNHWRAAVGASFAITGGVVREIDPSEIFVPRARLDHAVASQCRPTAHVTCDTTQGLQFTTALEAGSLDVVWWAGGDEDYRTFGEAHFPFGELAPWLRRDGPVARLPGGIPHDAIVQTELTRQISPGVSWTVVPSGDAGSFTELAAAVTAPGFELDDVHWQRLSESRAQLVGDYALSGTPPRAPSETLPRGPGGLVFAVSARDRVAVRAAPRDGGRARSLPMGTVLTAFTGPFADGDSVLTPIAGLWTYVVAGTTAGWVASDAVEPAWTACPLVSRDALTPILPDDARDDIARDTVFATSWVNGTCDAAIALARHGSTESFAALSLPDRAGSRVVTRVRVEGEITDAAALSTHASTSEVNVLAVAARVAGDPPGIERWSFFVGDGGAPGLVLSLASAAAGRARVTVEDDASGEHAFLVHGGPSDGAYDWNGTAFAAAS